MKKASLPLLSNRELIQIVKIHQTHRMPIEAIVNSSVEAEHVKKQIERLMVFAGVRQAKDIEEVAKEKKKNDIMKWHFFLSQYSELDVDLNQS